MRWILVGLTLATLPVGTFGQKAPQMTPMMHEKSREMDTIHAIFGHTDKIKRTVRDTPNGVEAITESNDPVTARLIKQHAADMQHRLKAHHPIREWDPLFAALFAHADKINLKVIEKANGVRVTETTADPETLRLMRAHAAAVSGFVHDGPAGMAKRHDLPGETAKTTGGFLGKGDGVRTCPVTGEPVDKKVKAQILGRTVYFCCASCVDVVKKKPGLYLRP